MTNVLLGIIAACSLVMASETVVFAIDRIRARMERQREVRALAGKFLEARKIAAEQLGVDESEVPIPDAKIIPQINHGDLPTMDEGGRDGN